jgi:hypothetical protein
MLVQRQPDGAELITGGVMYIDGGYHIINRGTGS